MGQLNVKSVKKSKKKNVVSTNQVKIFIFA